MKIELSAAERRDLRARAHPLHPVAGISARGLTPGVLAEIESGLRAHELIKVRTYGADRAQREAFLEEICERLDAAPVQLIGHVLVVFRPRPPEQPVAPAPAPAARKPRPRAASGASRPGAAGARPAPRKAR